MKVTSCSTEKHQDYTVILKEESQRLSGQNRDAGCRTPSFHVYWRPLLRSTGRLLNLAVDTSTAEKSQTETLGEDVFVCTYAWCLCLKFCISLSQGDSCICKSLHYSPFLPCLHCCYPILWEGIKNCVIEILKVHSWLAFPTLQQVPSVDNLPH